MNTLRVSRAAQADVLEIWTYIAESSPDAADRVVDGIRNVFADLARFPGMGRRRDRLAPGLRSFAVGSYVVYYRQTGVTVEIARVLHGARNAARIFRRGM